MENKASRLPREIREKNWVFRTPCNKKEILPTLNPTHEKKWSDLFKRMPSVETELVRVGRRTDSNRVGLF